ncbi:MAG TPA: hypothetical protein VF550_18845 [Polyangia bacterium]
MRATGYLSPLVIDSGGCGQDTADIATYIRVLLLYARPMHAASVLFDIASCVAPIQVIP